MKKTVAFFSLLVSIFIVTTQALAYDLALERQKALNWVSLQRVRNGVTYDWVAVNDTATYGYTYDNALAIIAYTAVGKLDDARALLNFLSRYQLSDGSFYDSMFQATGTVRNATRSSGNQAWALYAVAFYTHQTGDSVYLPMADRIASWLIARQDPADGGITGGLNSNGSERLWTSTEHNLDIYFALKLYGVVTNNAYYLDKANRCKDWLLNVGWNSAENRFNTGENDPSKFLDPQSIGVIFMNDIGDLTKRNALLKYADRNFGTRKSFGSGSVRQSYSGYEYGSKDGSLWWEGTEQMAIAYGRSGSGSKELNLVNHILASDDPTRLGSDNDGDGGLQYSMVSGTNQLGTVEQPSPGLWLIFAINDYLKDQPTLFYPTVY